MLRVLDDEIGVFEADGGVLDPERAVEAHLRAGRRGRRSDAFRSRDGKLGGHYDGFAVRLADGTIVQSRALVLSLGPWFQDALGKTRRRDSGSSAMFRLGFSPGD